jgi:conjugal transfer pilus assembly protein TraE
MNVKNFVDQTQNTVAENKLLRFAIIVVGISSVFSAIMSYSALHYQKVVILPPVVDRKIEVSGTDMNDDYFKLYAKYITDLLVNYTQATFNDQAHDLLALCTPEFYPSLEKKLSDINEGVRKLDITSVFYPIEIHIDKGKHTLTITGDHEQRARSIAVAHDKKTYIITYQINIGRFQINDIVEENK